MLAPTTGLKDVLVFDRMRGCCVLLQQPLGVGF